MNIEKPLNSNAENFRWEQNELKETKELSSKEKGAITDSWVKMVVDNEEVPGGVEHMDNEEIKAWLYQSLMSDTGRLIDEWGIKPDKELISKIQKEKDSRKRTDYEIKYIESIHKKIQQSRNSFENARKKKHVEKSNKWDSWPKKMREVKDFNCVGATIIGMKFLEDAGIESYHGTPSGHSVNVVHLSNGEWYYEDFLNNIRQTQKMSNIEEVEIAGVRVLKPAEPVNDYKFIPIQQNSEVPEAILGNLSVLSSDVQDQKTPKTHEGQLEKHEAEKFFIQYSAEYKNTDFHKMKSMLYPKRYALNESEEMSREHDRIEFIQNLEQPIQEYTRSLSKKQIDKLIEEVREKIKDIKEFFSGDDKILSGSSETLGDVLRLYRESLGKVRSQKQGLYQEAVNMVIGRWENLSRMKYSHTENRLKKN